LGHVEFDDGFKAKWILKSSGISTLNWSLGGDVILLYKKNKWTDPYAGLYDDNYDEEGNPK
jgi:hypothetical protein